MEDDALVSGASVQGANNRSAGAVVRSEWRAVW
jgi:hypothetical protein